MPDQAKVTQESCVCMHTNANHTNKRPFLRSIGQLPDLFWSFETSWLSLWVHSTVMASDSIMGLATGLANQ